MPLELKPGCLQATSPLTNSTLRTIVAYRQCLIGRCLSRCTHRIMFRFGVALMVSPPVIAAYVNFSLHFLELVGCAGGSALVSKR